MEGKAAVTLNASPVWPVVKVQVGTGGVIPSVSEQMTEPGGSDPREGGPDTPPSALSVRLPVQWHVWCGWNHTGSGLHKVIADHNYYYSELCVITINPQPKRASMPLKRIKRGCDHAETAWSWHGDRVPLVLFLCLLVAVARACFLDLGDPNETPHCYGGW